MEFTLVNHYLTEQVMVGKPPEGRGGGWGGVTKIVDRRQQAVRRAGAAGPAAPGKSALSRGVTPGAPPPGRVFHLQTVCSILEHEPLLHPPISAEVALKG